jgi:hypothetical protein
MKQQPTNTAQQIQNEVERLVPGKPVAINTFLGFGKRAAVDQALSRLVRAGELSRPIRGVYVRPKRSRFVGEVPPDPHEIARAIAAASNEVVQVHGAEAARQLGLSTQVPMKHVFYTTGRGKTFAYGNTTVLMKHVPPQRLALAGRPAGIALEALRYLGKKAVTTRTMATIKIKIGIEEFRQLEAATNAMPGWLHDLFVDYRTDGPHA